MRIHWFSIEETWIPFTQGCFLPRLVEIGPMVLEKRIFTFHQCIFAISWLSPLGKLWGPSLEETQIPITQGCFMPSLVEIGKYLNHFKIWVLLVWLKLKSKIPKPFQNLNINCYNSTKRKLTIMKKYSII